MTGLLKNSNFIHEKLAEVSCIKLYKELNNQYNKIHKVTYLLNKKDINCVKELENWLSTTENILKDNDCVERNLITQFRGQFHIERTRKDKIMTKKNRELNAVSQLMEPTKKAVLNMIKPINQKIDESNVIIKGMLSQKNFHYNNGLNYRDYILAVWRTLLNENTTKIEAKKLQKLMHEEDILELISKHLKQEQN